MKILIGLSLIALMGCGSAQNNASSNPTLYAYGDSVTYGAFTNHISYVNEISQIIGYNLNNKAISGTAMTSPNQYPLMMSDTWPSGSIIFFTPGANDSSLAQDQNYLSEYTQDLTDILQKACNSQVIFYLGTPVTPLNDSDGWNTANVAVFANINKSIAQSIDCSNIVVIDFNTLYMPTSQTDADTYHPNILGYQEMTQIFFNIIK